MPWKLLILVAACVVLYKLFMNDRGRKDQDEKKTRDRKIAKGEMVKDPVCGTYVEIESAISVRDGGKTHVFCSYDCRQKFLDGLTQSGREIPQLEKDEE